MSVAEKLLSVLRLLSSNLILHEAFYRIFFILCTYEEEATLLHARDDPDLAIRIFCERCNLMLVFKPLIEHDSVDPILQKWLERENRRVGTKIAIPWGLKGFYWGRCRSPLVTSCSCIHTGKGHEKSYF